MRPSPNLNVSPPRMSEDVKLGPNHLIDPGVLLGYVPGRRIGEHRLVIGPGARIRSGTVVHAGTTIGARLETGHNVVIREQSVIGDDFNIWSNSVVDYGCEIGCRVKVHCNVYIAQFTTLEDDVFLAPGVAMANDPHPMCGLCMRGPTIRRGARIGVNVTLLSHITVGEGALIGAGSVVTRDIPPFTLAYGNPARPLQTVDELSCSLDMVERPYVNGLDVQARQAATRSHS